MSDERCGSTIPHTDRQCQRRAGHEGHHEAFYGSPGCVRTYRWGDGHGARVTHHMCHDDRTEPVVA